MKNSNIPTANRNRSNSASRAKSWLAASALALLAGGAFAFLAAEGPDNGGRKPGPSTARPQAVPPEGNESHRHTNHLIHETSPYLLQHAHNPVNWFAWGKEAFAKAKKEGKPIFLSVGYSTCYWCHVMERESFENDEVAKILNEYFVAIKVDREERPDIDEQYMLATQLVTGRGGWPNSLWLTPDGRPWMAGTYFPRERFTGLLKRLAQLWREDRESVERQADALAAAIKRTASGGPQLGDQAVNRELVGQALAAIRANFDSQHGGFGGEPKFPPHGDLRLLIHEIRRSDDADCKRMLTRTLDAMWHGGIRDHVGGGFHRYATDNRWFLPHFEKMLYDNAQLIHAYTDAYGLTGEDRYRQAVADIFAWVEREMTHPAGAFYSAIDSESEGQEGKFYVWSLDELVKVLGEEDARLFADVYGCQREGNFAEEATGERPRTNILYLPRPISEVASDKGIDPEKLASDLAAMRDKLLAARNRRTFPHRDDKVLAGWNGLMIAALAHAGDEFDEPRYTQAAERAADFLLEHMQKDGRVLRTWRSGKARLPGYLDDYTFVAQGFLELHETTGDSRWLQQARTLVDSMLAQFQDGQNGGFYFTSGEHQELLTRSKNLLGGGNIPSGNGVAAQVLLRLGGLTGDQRYSDAARRTLKAFAGRMADSPDGLESLILATAMFLDRRKPSGGSAEDGPAVVGGNPAGVYKIGPVTARLSASQSAVRPGQAFHVDVRLDIDHGWHLYGPNPDAKFLVPTTLSFQPDDTVIAGQVQLPTPFTKDDPVAGQSLQIYEGSVQFRVPLTVAENTVQGNRVLKLQLRTQACDENRCLAPETTILEFPVTVVARAAEGEGRAVKRQLPSSD